MEEKWKFHYQTGKQTSKMGSLIILILVNFSKLKFSNNKHLRQISQTASISETAQKIIVRIRATGNVQKKSPC